MEINVSIVYLLYVGILLLLTLLASELLISVLVRIGITFDVYPLSQLKKSNPCEIVAARVISSKMIFFIFQVTVIKISHLILSYLYRVRQNKFST